MCGICGIYSFDRQRAVSSADLCRMRDTMAHRGPDGVGSVVMGHVGLGHRRLSIVDLTGGHQPMGNEDGSMWIVYVGEIYNFQGLRADLEAKGYDFKTKSDTEVILRAYEAFGSACVEHLRGMFAFAIWDAPR